MSLCVRGRGPGVFWRRVAMALGGWLMGAAPAAAAAPPPPPQDIHYTVDEKQRNVLLTEDGYEAVEDVLQVCVWGGGGTMYVYVTACTGWACE